MYIKLKKLLILVSEWLWKYDTQIKKIKGSLEDLILCICAMSVIAVVALHAGFINYEEGSTQYHMRYVTGILLIIFALWLACSWSNKHSRTNQFHEKGTIKK